MASELFANFYAAPVSVAGNSPQLAWPGGRGEFWGHGTWNGATATLQCQLGDGTWVPVDRTGDTYCTLTADGHGGFELGPCNLRVALTGGPPTSFQAGVRNTGRSM